MKYVLFVMIGTRPCEVIPIPYKPIRHCSTGKTKLSQHGYHVLIICCDFDFVYFREGTYMKEECGHRSFIHSFHIDRHRTISSRSNDSNSDLSLVSRVISNYTSTLIDGHLFENIVISVNDSRLFQWTPVEYLRVSIHF